MLRRTKHMLRQEEASLVALPPIQFQIEKTPLSGEALDYYESISDTIEEQVKSAVKAGLAKQHFSTFGALLGFSQFPALIDVIIALYLYRLRQLARGQGLCPPSFPERFAIGFLSCALR